MNDVQIKILRELRHEGYAVVIWTPEELGDANPRRVEDRIIELGWDVIADLGGPQQDNKEKANEVL